MSAAAAAGPAKDLHEDELVDYDETDAAQNIEPAKQAQKAKEVTRSAAGQPHANSNLVHS